MVFGFGRLGFPRGFDAAHSVGLSRAGYPREGGEGGGGGG